MSATKLNKAVPVLGELLRRADGNLDGATVQELMKVTTFSTPDISRVLRLNHYYVERSDGANSIVPVQAETRFRLRAERLPNFRVMFRTMSPVFSVRVGALQTLVE